MNTIPDVFDEYVPNFNRRSPRRGLEVSVTNTFTRLNNGTWLHDRPKDDVFRLLAEVYRFRIYENLLVDGDRDPDCINGGDPYSGREGVFLFVNRVQDHHELLPS